MKKFITEIDSRSDKSLLSLNSLLAEELGKYAELPVPSQEFMPSCAYHHNKSFDTQPFHKHITRMIENFKDDE